MAKPIEFNWTTQERIKSHEEYLRGTRSQPQSLAASLNWTTAVAPDTVIDEEMPDVLAPDVKFPDTLVDDPKDSDDAVDHSDGTKSHDTSAALSFATNWDALLDTAGVPTDGTPPDPLAAQQQQEQLEEQAARQAQMVGLGNGGSQPGGTQPGGTQPGVTTPQMPATPATPQAQDKAKQKQRAGRGVEGRVCPDGYSMPATGCGDCPGCDEDPPNPIEGRTCPSGDPMPAEGCGDCTDCDEGPTNPMDPGNKYDWDSFSTTPRI